jgi:glycine hydroxymethyltransferase
MTTDQIITDLIAQEAQRQRTGLELIPSENYASKAVLAAMGSELTNKYSEGYPGRRYYGGQEFTDKIETIAIDRAKQLFGADHANVQPLGGAAANEAMYHAWLEPGDTVLAMKLDHGGHLTHGHPVTVLARTFNFVRYGMKNIDTGEIDYEELMRVAKLEKPKMIMAGFSAYPRELDYAKFKEVADEVGAVLVADIAHIAGLIAGKQLANPFDYGFHILTTTTHKTLRGPRGGMILSKGTVGNPLKAPEKTVDNLPTLIDRTVFPGLQGGPHMHAVAAKAVSFHEALQPEFETYAKQVILNAKELAKCLLNNSFNLVTGGTDNHLILADVVKSHNLDGKVVEEVLDKIGLNLNKNAVPNDINPPFKPSGIRLGTPALTTRGLKETDMKLIADWMSLAIDAREDSAKLSQIKQEVTDFSLRFPLPSDR